MSSRNLVKSKRSFEDEEFDCDATESTSCSSSSSDDIHWDAPPNAASIKHYMKFVLLLTFVYIGISFVCTNPNLTSSLANQNNRTTLTKKTKGWVPNPEHFRSCQADNEVLSRGGWEGMDHEDTEYEIRQKLEGEATRPYSLRAQDFAVDKNKPVCPTLTQTLQAIQLGHRQWDTKKLQTSPDRERYPSRFLSHQCQIPWLDATEICDILNLYSSIIIAGDSLSRHIQAGLHTSLTNDFVSGFLEGSPTASEHCRCDGQFSEKDTCRDYPSDFKAITPNPQICPQLHRQDQSTFEEHFIDIYDGSSITDASLSPNWYEHCWETNSDGTPKPHKGVLLVLQGGLHQHFDAQVYQDTILHKILSDHRLKLCAENHHLYVVWLAHGSQSPQMDRLYPHQNATNILQFNGHISDYLKEVSLDTITQVDWMNFTKGAQVSDGVHFLTNVNYFKAQYLMQIAKLMKQEKRYVVLKTQEKIPHRDQLMEEDAARLRAAFDAVHRRRQENIQRIKENIKKSH